jgi:polar amino acid transport system substrate-binding protein
MKKKLVLTLLLCLLVVVGLSGCFNDKSSEAEKKTIKIAANVGNVPWEFEDGGELVGFEVDLINAIAENLNYDLEFINTPFTGLFPGLLGGKFDVVISSITIKPDRVEKMDFTQPYYDSNQSLVVKKANNLGLSDLKGKVIGVESGGTPDIWATENKDKFGFKEVRLYNSFPEAMLDLASTRLDGVVGDMPASLYYIKDKPEFVVSETIETNEKYGMAFKKGSPLRDEINEEISKLKEDGTMAKIYKKWFGEDAVGSTLEVLPVPDK